MYTHARGAASRGRRRGKLGKVIVLPGIMGSELDSVDAKGDADRIWLNFPRLLGGRIRDLELAADGSPAPQGVHVRTAGLHRKTYLAMLLELDTRWIVRPFPFDWREDIDKSADRLAGEVQAFGGGDPVHLVAHSMGGLVSRRFIQRHADLWESMDDADGQGRGGRLVMLGTPNHGSFAIPLTLTGAEKLVKLLARADFRTSKEKLLAILGTFPGLYDMLPSPFVDLDDDHARLFQALEWGKVPARAPLLARANSLIRDLRDVVDPLRFVYVAGYNQRTPSAIRIDGAGKFSYRETFDGDGRVPHLLGLLGGVPTYWVFEIHGSLAKNVLVLDAITDLLQRGATSRLPSAKPAEPAPDRALRRGWVSGDQIEPVDPAIDTILAGARGRSAEGIPTVTAEEEIELEDLGVDDYLGRGGAVLELPPGEQVPEPPPREVSIQVVWGDVTTVEANVYAVGHYEGVEPQRAELALDRAVSGVNADESHDQRGLVITQQTRRGMLRGALGDVSFFPWGDDAHPDRVVAVAGMGRPGTFNRAGLRRLVRSVMVAIGTLPRAKVVATVLIGSGEGTLTIGDSLRGLVEGLGEAAEEIALSEELGFVAPVTTLLIVERERGRAAEILEALRSVLDEQEARKAAGSRVPIAFHLKKTLAIAPRGVVSVEESVALLADVAIRFAAAPPDSIEAKALAPLLEQIGQSKQVRNFALRRLAEAEATARTTSRRPRFRVESRKAQQLQSDIAVRVSFWSDGPAIRVAAIHEAATVPERIITVSSGLIDDLVEKMIDPPEEAVDDLCRLLYRLLVPAEFRGVLRSGPCFVFEVDRSMARVQWELLAGDVLDEGEQKPLAVTAAVARQIRTQYSPSPLPPRRPGQRLRALVVGDPGDPALGHDLPGARREALRVVEILKERHVDVTALIGAPTISREGSLKDVRPADRLEVLGLLLEGGFDLLHYAGHGDFDPQDPTRAGWLFARGLLTGAEIGRIENVPAIVFANACLSAQTSQALAGGRSVGEDRSEAALLPSLVDEFFRLGVRNYVGTAWEVNDVGAELFAEVFYDALLPRSGEQGASFGEAVRLARASLWEHRADFGALWAAYQHYGDPTVHATLAGPSAR